MDSDNHMLVDIPVAVDEPDDVVRWVPSQTSNPVLQALIHQAEQDKKSQPSLPCISEPLWTHTLPSTTSTLWPSSTAPPTSRVSSLPSFGDTSFLVPPREPSGSDPSSSSSSGRTKISSGAHRKPLSASVNHPARSGRTTSKHDPLSKRPRSSSYSSSGKEKPKASLADREQDPDAAAFLALLRDVSKQLDDNARKKQIVSTKLKDQRQRGDAEGDETHQSSFRGSHIPPPARERGKEGERARAGGSHDLSLNGSSLVPDTSFDTVSQRTDQRPGETFGVPCRNTNVPVKSTPSAQLNCNPSGRSMTKSATSGSRTIMRVSSMDPNVPSRRDPVSHTRNLSRTTSTSTITSGSHHEHAAYQPITPTFDRHTRVQVSVSGNVAGERLKHTGTVTEDSPMAVDPDTSSGDRTNSDNTMDVPSFPKSKPCPKVPDNSKPQPVTCTQRPAVGQARSTPHRPPALGMRRPVITPSNGPGSASAFPSPSQYGAPSQPPKATAVPRFKPPLPKPPILKGSTGSAYSRPSSVVNGTESDITRLGVGAGPRSPAKVACVCPETDPDSSFDISFDMDADMLEEAMRPYD
ncbi:hypothetical protein F5J12DRAFT_814452 [Pisolithus orientalis]|uniref:uncharacterized protein n=1 Tax=Pisolithus orientalis TaxID=936130 RepID=UPI0022240417|nr:uncharacterized protein F5J12DRAFT_814452 [Pisolithus orientalis]KAI6019967.1 hypothetical protein F5J12DRAFT_814452 [Pisolithus orientalis]